MIAASKAKRCKGCKVSSQSSSVVLHSVKIRLIFSVMRGIPVDNDRLAA